MTPPTVEEIAAFVAEKRLALDPVKFHAHYSARNWCYGGRDGDKTPMKSWKKACYSWQRNEIVSVKKHHLRAMVGSHGMETLSIAFGETSIREPEKMPEEIRDIQRRADNRGELLDGELERLIEWKRAHPLT